MNTSYAPELLEQLRRDPPDPPVATALARTQPIDWQVIGDALLDELTGTALGERMLSPVVPKGAPPFGTTDSRCAETR